MGKQCSSKLCQSSNHLKGAKALQHGSQDRGPWGGGCPMLATVGAQWTNCCSAGSRQQIHSSVPSEPPLPSLTVTVGFQPHSHFCSFSRSSSRTRHSPEDGWKGLFLSQKHHCGLASTCPPCRTYQLEKGKLCRGRWGANYRKQKSKQKSNHRDVQHASPVESGLI